MTEIELFDALDGLHAYDEGSDSGIRDEALRERVKKTMEDMSEDEFRMTLSRFIRGMLSDRMLAQGYGIEDVASFLRWLDERMGVQL